MTATILPLGRTFFRLWKITPIKALIPAFLSSLCATFADVTLMGAAAYLIASCALHPPLYTLTLTITLVRAAGISRAVFRYLDRYLSHRAAFSLLTNVRLKLYQKATQLIPMKEGLLRQGEFLHRLTHGTNLLRDFYLRALMPPLLVLTLAMISFLILFPLNSFCAALFPTLCIVHIIASFSVTPTITLQTTFSRYKDRLLDFWAGKDELHTHGTTESAKSVLQQASIALSHRQHSQRQKEISLDFILSLSRNLLLVYLIYTLALLVEKGRLSGIELAVYFLATKSILKEYAAIPLAIRTSFSTLKQADELLDVPANPAPVSHSFGQTFVSACEEDLLIVQNISFSYEANTPILNNLSFTLKAGTSLAICGESGSGKTTLCHLLLGLWHIDNGTLAINGMNFNTLSEEQIRSFFAVSLQGEKIFHTSIRENFLRLHGHLTDAEIYTALEIVQLTDLLSRLPKGIDTEIGEDGSSLSGGERKRLTIALALASSAPILLLDEPTAGLDKETAIQMMEHILLNLNGRSLIVVTHDQLLARQMDTTLDLEE